MNRLVVIIVAFCYLSGVFAPFYTYAGYFLNKNFIIENFCINKKKPELSCDGKCYLSKQIGEQTQKTTDTRSPQNENNKSLAAHVGVNIKPINFAHQSLLLKLHEGYTINPQHAVPAIFSPPKFLA